MPNNTGSGRDPVLNRGGRPRKDGTPADPNPTLASYGFSKRDADRIRRLARYSEEEFETALAKWSADKRRTVESIFHYLPDPKANSRPEREAGADIARLFSTLRRIEKHYEFDASKQGQLILELVKYTIEVWSRVK
jgi:hypothetical protein